MINIKRIIREELEAVLDSFYLIVSEDEKFIYRKGFAGGGRWESTKNLTPKEIINSGFKEYSEPEEMISRMNRALHRGLTNLIPKDQDTKIVPKIVPVDFIIKKREETFPILESKNSDFKWIEDTTPFKPGILFGDDDICFNSEDCDININKDNITFKIDWEEWYEAVEGDPDDWVLKDVLFHGPNYDGDGDFHEFDEDEFNYSGYQMNEVQRIRLDGIFHRTDPDLDFNMFVDDYMNGLFGGLRYPKLKSLFWELRDNYLDIVGYSVQRNRWLSVGSEIREKIKRAGIDFSLSSSFGGHELKIVVPIDKVFKTYNEKNITDLSELVLSVSEFLVRPGWYDRFFDEWDISGDEEKIWKIFDDFLDKSEDFLEDKNTIKLYEKLIRMLGELGFVDSNRRLENNTTYHKKVLGDKTLTLSINAHQYVLRLYDSSYRASAFPGYHQKYISQWVFNNPINVNEIKNKILSVSK